MRIRINDHIDGTEVVETPGNGGRATHRPGVPRGLERLRQRLDHPRRVLMRDFIIFELKQLLDSFKGLVVSQVAIVAFLIDLVRPGGRSMGLFYRVLDFGERFDIWISLYSASRHAGENPEGLLGESREGSHTLLGQLEQVVHRVVVGDHGEGELYPRPARPHATAGSWGPPPAAGSPEPPPRPAPAAAAGPAPGEPVERSSFEAENYARGTESP